MMSRSQALTTATDLRFKETRHTQSLRLSHHQAGQFRGRKAAEGSVYSKRNAELGR
jgi:hypothetical protein